MRLELKQAMTFTSFILILGLLFSISKFFSVKNDFLDIDLISLWSCIGTIAALVVTIASIYESQIEYKKNSMLGLANTYYRNSLDQYGYVYNAVPTTRGVKELFYGSIAVKTVIDDYKKGRFRDIKTNFGFSELKIYLNAYEIFIKFLLINSDILGEEYSVLKELNKLRNQQITIHIKEFLTDLAPYEMGTNRKSINESLEIIERIEKICINKNF